MTAPDLQTLAQIFTGRLLNTAVAGLVLAGMVWMQLRFIGRQNSGTRFAIWFSALLAIVALPFFSGSRFLASHFRDLPAAMPHGTITLSSSWAFYLFAAWGVEAGLLLLRLSVGLWRVRQLRRHCSPVDLAPLDPAIAGILQDFGSRRSVTLCVSRDVAIPTAIGFFQSAIVFPAWLLSELSAAEIKVILLHELAHLRRFDDWTNLAQKIVKAVFFFHPAVWWIENRLTLEREMACDDMVLAQTVSPRAYASSLISFAEKLQTARGLALAQALVSRMRHMTLRVAQILDAKRPTRPALWTPVLGLSAGMLALVFVAAPCAPQFVAFQPQARQGKPEFMQATKGEAQLATVRAAVSHTGIANVASQPRMIPASFKPRAAAPVARRLKTTSPHKPSILRASAVQQDIPPQQTFFILQTTQYDASGSGFWTLCIWRVRAGSVAERQLQSAIILDSI